MGRKDILARADLRANGKLLATGFGRFARSSWMLKEHNFFQGDQER